MIGGKLSVSFGFGCIFNPGINCDILTYIYSIFYYIIIKSFMLGKILQVL